LQGTLLSLLIWIYFLLTAVLNEIFGDFKISKVVVYRDRAEITRIVEFTPTASNIKASNGEGVVVIGGITRLANLEALSVKPLVRNVFDILEVSHEDVIPSVAASGPSTMDEDAAGSGSSTANEIAALRQRQEEIEDELSQLYKKRSRFEESISLTKSFASKALSPSVRDASSGAGVPADGGRVSVEQAQSVLRFHAAELERLDDELFAVTKTIQAKEKILKDVKATLSPKTPPNNKSTGPRDNYKSVSVTFEIVGFNADSALPDLSFSLSYIVPNAYWTPAYDVRVSTSSSATPTAAAQDDCLTLSYFAEVTQVSGEDWRDCDLVLSTSNPAISSQPPAIKSKSVDFYQAYRSNTRSNNNSSYGEPYRRGSEDDDGGSRASFALMDDGFPGQQDYFASAAVSQVALNEAYRAEGGSGARRAELEGTGDAGSTVFTLPRKCSIASDNKPHKVLVMARRFKPQIVHYSVPSESPHVYIQAKVRNSSGYPLLTSSTVNIYLDGNFVSKSSLKHQANPGETFQLFLGVDAALKVEYLPTRYEEYRKGWMMAGTEVKKVYHKTVITNAKSCDVRIIVADALPMPSNDKISVELMEPAPSSVLENSSKAAFGSAQEAVTNLSALSQEGDGAPASSSASSASSTAEPAWPADFITKNKVTNNIIWFKTIRAGDKAEIPFSYRLAWPQGQNIYINEK
jgi:archaellum component FlaF (FlaF/FlaG flagellin family)